MAWSERYLINGGRSLLGCLHAGLALLGFVFVGAVIAAGPTAKPTGAVLSVLAVGESSLPEGLHRLDSPDEGTPLKTSFVRRSELLPAVPGKSVVFGVPRQNPATGESRFVTLCSVDWPEGVQDRVLVLLASDGGKLSGIAIDDGEKVFPRETLRVVNLVKRPMAARWGDQTWELPPGPGPARPYPAVTKGAGGQPGRFKVMLGVRWGERDEANIIYAGRIEARPNVRTLLVVREFKETAITETGEALDVGVSYNTRWVVEALPKPEVSENAR